MARRIEFSPGAVEEAGAAREWYESRSVSAAEAFVSELDAAVVSVAEAPSRFPQYLYGTRRCPFHRFPYVLIYRDKGAVVEVVAVAHTRRRPGYWRWR
jgi:plasmid stabilization system protein ParE